MNLLKWTEEKMKKLKWYDMGLVKLCCFAGALMVAKLWAPILSLEWYWYGLIFLLSYIPIFYKILIKK